MLLYYCHKTVIIMKSFTIKVGAVNFNFLAPLVFQK